MTTLRPEAPPPPPEGAATSNPTLGVFDSGVGGLSVLVALRRHLPGARLLYVADSGHAPYGHREVSFVQQRSEGIAAWLLGRGAQSLVVACNTATAAAVDALRARWPQVPVVGVEPGVKPAVAATRCGRIGVLATPGTLASERFRRLAEREAAGVVLVTRPCPDLAALIERGDLDAPDLRHAVHEHCAALRREGVDTVVLGCTHYTFVRPIVQAEMGDDVRLIDTGDAVARQAMRRLGDAAAAGESPGTPPLLLTTGSVPQLERIAAAWLPFPCEVRALPG